MEESLRMYPPLPIGAPRRAPDGGAVVGDFIVPRDVSHPTHNPK